MIFLFDVTKAWTFEYLTREVPKVPPHIPVLVLANFIDKAHHRVVTREQALGFIEHLEGKRLEILVGNLGLGPAVAKSDPAVAKSDPAVAKSVTL